MIPGGHRLEIKKRKDHEDQQGDDFLDDLQLEGGVAVAAPAVGRHLQQIFKKRDGPAYNDDQQQRFALVFQMSIPRAGHEKVGANEEHDRQPAGLSQVIHKKCCA